MAVAGVARIAHQHLVTGIDEYAQGELQRPGCSGCDYNSFRRDLDLIAVAIIPRDRLAQRGQSERRGVMGATGTQRRNSRLHDAERTIEIRLSDLHVHDGAILTLQRARACQHVHDMEGIDVAHPVRDPAFGHPLVLSLRMRVVPTKPRRHGRAAVIVVRWDHNGYHFKFKVLDKSWR